MKLYSVTADEAIYYVAATSNAEAIEVVMKYEAEGEISNSHSCTEVTKDIQVYDEHVGNHTSGFELANECRKPTIIACSEW